MKIDTKRNISIYSTINKETKAKTEECFFLE